MATKKRKAARGGELWAVIDTRTGEIAWQHGDAVVKETRDDARWWRNFALCGAYRVQRILWRPAPARRRAKR